ncbi:hypothetical protein WJX75_003451 [Coccomyxa subellipsoidea]|uniref:FHA domain-containing protein n=1 Tax=Coccomyxa subellipsoidea TaxID=248742 RepID=A0ABR2YVP7_9CHLO
MAGHVPDWVHASIQQGYIVKARCPDGDISRVAFGEKGYLLFGRNGQVCECEVAHKSASRVHACLGFDGDQFQIQDLDSSHGTLQ